MAVKAPRDARLDTKGLTPEPGEGRMTGVPYELAGDKQKTDPKEINQIPNKEMGIEYLLFLDAQDSKRRFQSDKRAPSCAVAVCSWEMTGPVTSSAATSWRKEGRGPRAYAPFGAGRETGHQISVVAARLS